MIKNQTSQLKTIVLATALTSGFLATTPATAAPVGMEKCYGVNAAHKNDCASKGSNMSCAGQAKQAQHPHAFVVMPQGTCNKLHKGSTQPGVPLDPKHTQQPTMPSHAAPMQPHDQESTSAQPTQPATQQPAAPAQKRGWFSRF